MWKIKVNCASMTIKTNDTSIYPIDCLLPRPEKKKSSHEAIKSFMTKNNNNKLEWVYKQILSCSLSYINMISFIKAAS